MVIADVKGKGQDWQLHIRVPQSELDGLLPQVMRLHEHRAHDSDDSTRHTSAALSGLLKGASGLQYLGESLRESGITTSSGIGMDLHKVLGYVHKYQDSPLLSVGIDPLMRQRFHNVARRVRVFNQDTGQEITPESSNKQQPEHRAARADTARAAPKQSIAAGNRPVPGPRVVPNTGAAADSKASSRGYRYVGVAGEVPPPPTRKTKSPAESLGSQDQGDAATARQNTGQQDAQAAARMQRSASGAPGDLEKSPAAESSHASHAQAAYAASRRMVEETARWSGLPAASRQAQLTDKMLQTIEGIKDKTVLAGAHASMKLKELGPYSTFCGDEHLGDDRLKNEYRVWERHSLVLGWERKEEDILPGNKLKQLIINKPLPGGEFLTYWRYQDPNTCDFTSRPNCPIQGAIVTKDNTVYDDLVAHPEMVGAFFATAVRAADPRMEHVLNDQEGKRQCGPFYCDRRCHLNPGDKVLFVQQKDATGPRQEFKFYFGDQRPCQDGLPENFDLKATATRPITQELHRAAAVAPAQSAPATSALRGPAPTRPPPERRTPASGSSPRPATLVRAQAAHQTQTATPEKIDVTKAATAQLVRNTAQWLGIDPNSREAQLSPNMLESLEKIGTGEIKVVVYAHFRYSELEATRYLPGTSSGEEVLGFAFAGTKGMKSDDKVNLGGSILTSNREYRKYCMNADWPKDYPLDHLVSIGHRTIEDRMTRRGGKYSIWQDKNLVGKHMTSMSWDDKHMRGCEKDQDRIGCYFRVGVVTEDSRLYQELLNSPARILFFAAAARKMPKSDDEKNSIEPILCDDRPMRETPLMGGGSVRCNRRVIVRPETKVLFINDAPDSAIPWKIKFLDGKGPLMDDIPERYRF